MDEVLDAELLEVLHTCRRTGNDEDLFGVLELLPCLRRKGCVLVIGRTEDDDVRFRLASRRLLRCRLLALQRSSRHFVSKRKLPKSSLSLSC